MDCDSSERREKIVAGMRTEGVHLGKEIVIVIVKVSVNFTFQESAVIRPSGSDLLSPLRRNIWR